MRSTACRSSLSTRKLVSYSITSLLQQFNHMRYSSNTPLSLVLTPLLPLICVRSHRPSGPHYRQLRGRWHHAAAAHFAASSRSPQRSETCGDPPAPMSHSNTTLQSRPVRAQCTPRTPAISPFARSAWTEYRKSHSLRSLLRFLKLSLSLRFFA